MTNSDLNETSPADSIEVEGLEDVTYSLLDPNSLNLNIVDPNEAVLYPYSAICQLKIQYPTQPKKKGGTGFLVGPKTILTAGHNIIHPKWKAASSIQVIIGGARGSAAYGIPSLNFTLPNPNVVTSEGWRSQPVDGSPLDYAFISLDTPYGNKTGTFICESMEMLMPKHKQLSVMVAGFPCDLGRADLPINFGEVYVGKGKVKAIEGNMLQYYMSTVPCMSGSPIFYLEKQGANTWAVCCAVHTSGIQLQYNQGPCMYEQFFKDVTNKIGK
jgi:V8-like Glu-specific endopeptidase